MPSPIYSQIKAIQFNNFIQIGNLNYASLCAVKISSPKNAFLVLNQCFCVDVNDVIGVFHDGKSECFHFTIIL